MPENVDASLAIEKTLSLYPICWLRLSPQKGKEKRTQKTRGNGPDREKEDARMERTEEQTTQDSCGRKAERSKKPPSSR